MSRGIIRAATGTYLVVFFAYLFLPLLVMAIPAFNASSYPRVLPFDGFTLDWFVRLAQDDTMLYGLRNSIWIGLLVVLVSVPVGLAGAVVMQRIHPRLRSLYYILTVAPILVPGVIIGISTVIFWREVTIWSGSRALYNGVFLTVLGQSSFISAYCMLLITARLQRFDRALEEAAFDLGATHSQVFVQILLPFLRPAILSAAVLAFLSSFENYNTTTFAILSDRTLTTVLAGQVRQGTTPTVSALAVTIIGATVIASLVFEAIRRRGARRRRGIPDAVAGQSAS
jgi:spermidine/putrescine transport system permease protein